MIKRCVIKALFLFLLFASVSYATQTGIIGPWMTGPLLAPAGHTIPAGHINIEPYVFYTDSYGFYNNKWKAISLPQTTNLSPTMIITYGLTHWMDIQTTIPYDFKQRSGRSANHIGDIGLILGFQALNGKLHTWKPDLRVVIEETFPTGRYNNLNPSKAAVEATGAGVYQTSFGTNFQKLFKLHNGKFLRARLSLIYTIPSQTNINGFSAYGGAANTRGRIRPGNRFNADFSLEYTLTQHWVPAIDVTANYGQGSSFSGFRGISRTGTIPMIGNGNNEAYTVAPAIEYNFSPNVGIIAGPWFTIRGKDTPEFVAAVIAINIYH